MMMFKHFKPRLEEPRTTTLTFAAILAKQLLDNKWDDGDNSRASNATPDVMAPPPPRMSSNSEVWQGAQTAPARFQTHVEGAMCALVKIEDEENRREGDKRKTCVVCWALLKKNVKTRWVCACLRKGICGPGTDRRCFEVHVENIRRGAAPEYREASDDAGLQGTRRARENV